MNFFKNLEHFFGNFFYHPKGQLIDKYKLLLFYL